MTEAAYAGPLEKADAAFQREDYVEAVKWLRKAADKGDAKAQTYLGLMYENGRGVAQDYAEAVKWYRSAAVQGDAGGQSSLGRMYEKGRGVEEDYVLAHMWFNLSAAKGRGFAEHHRYRVANLMTPQQIAEAQRLAREWQASR